MLKPSMRSLTNNRWVVGARPATLPAAVVPVVVGTASAWHDHQIIWWRAFSALVVALSFQVGANYANDYSDGVRGTDKNRVGPKRVTASGLAAPQSVRRAAYIAFAVACTAGLSLSIAVNPWLIGLGVVCVVAAWFYTGGKHPYGYMGLGELSVFVFFGLVAVCGCAYVQTERVTSLDIMAGAAIGSLACAMLVVNNLRDIKTDQKVNKKTLAVALGDARTRQLYSFLVLFPECLALSMGFVHDDRRPLLLGALAFPWAVMLTIQVIKGRSGKDLIATLKGTGKLQLIFGLLFSVGLALR